jgi:polysaccharide pyruvyl transferase WcaK-like protein
LPDYQKTVQEHDSKNRKVLILNAAFDRSELRFGNKTDEILFSISKSMLKAQTENWEIKVVAHKKMDRDIEPYLDKFGVDYVSYDISGGSSDDVIGFYAQSDLVVGMRGHAQMIPFGLRRPIISIISHDKMRFFLEDINCKEWGVDVNEVDFAQKLDNLIFDVAQNKPSYLKKLSDVQENLWKISQPNLGLIKNIFFKLNPKL